MLIAHVTHFYKNIFNMNITHDSVHIYARSANRHELTYEICEPVPDSPPPPKGAFFSHTEKSKRVINGQ